MEHVELSGPVQGAHLHPGHQELLKNKKKSKAKQNKNRLDKWHKPATVAAWDGAQVLKVSSLLHK